MKGRAGFKSTELDRIFNIVKICPTCHTYFDLHGAFTLHGEWRCWIFSDKPSFRDSNNFQIPNPFFGIKYAYSRPFVQRNIDSIEDDYIEIKQKEFAPKRSVGAMKFFSELEVELRQEGLWDEVNCKPLHGTLSSKIEFTLS